MSQKPLTILFVSDYCEDRHLVSAALTQSGVENKFVVVENGAELFDYLDARGEFSDRERYPLPGLILLDLDFPLKDSAEISDRIEKYPALKHIPVIALTMPQSDDNLQAAYGMRITGVIAKPVTFSGLVDVLKSLVNYWMQPAILPQPIA